MEATTTRTGCAPVPLPTSKNLPLSWALATSLTPATNLAAPPRAGKTTGTLAAFHAYASAALAHQIARRRQYTLDLTEALNHPTYRAFRTPTPKRRRRN